MFVKRASTLADGKPLPMKDVPKPGELAAAGAEVVMSPQARLIGGVPLHAVMGGFHLSGGNVEAIIPETILDLLAFGLKRIVPAHCTGWRAFTALANACGARRRVPLRGRTAFAF